MLRALRKRRSALPIALAIVAIPLSLLASIQEDLDRVEDALRTNPSKVMEQAVDSCLQRFRFAVRLYNSGHDARAARSLRHCFRVMRIPEEAPPPLVTAPSVDQLRTKAVREIESALDLEPDVANGLKIYRECAACHLPEGFGLSNGTVPQIAGQHRKVVIKQLADIRAGNRDAVLMGPYSSAESIGGAQAVADVAAYIDTLEISVATEKGPGDDLELGKALYAANCARCHGVHGEGSNATFVPRIQSQHYSYLTRQFEWIRDGKRRNANAEMAKQIQDFDERQTRAVLDYVTRLEPPPELQAPPGWKNPDFAQ